jgi:hypothetical protein
VGWLQGLAHDDAPDIHESVTFLLDLASLISWHHRQVFKGAA